MVKLSPAEPYASCSSCTWECYEALGEGPHQASGLRAPLQMPAVRESTSAEGGPQQVRALVAAICGICSTVAPTPLARCEEQTQDLAVATEPSSELIERRWRRGRGMCRRSVEVVASLQPFDGAISDTKGGE